MRCAKEITLFCNGYITSVVDALGAPNTVNGATACFPKGVIDKQLVVVVRHYLEAHPENRQLGAIGLVADALADAFPCK